MIHGQQNIILLGRCRRGKQLHIYASGLVVNKFIH
jgi:hypothetical protein